MLSCGFTWGQNPIFANREKLLFPQLEQLVTILIVENKGVWYLIIVQKHLVELNHSSSHRVTEMDFSIFWHFKREQKNKFKKYLKNSKQSGKMSCHTRNVPTILTSDIVFFPHFCGTKKPSCGIRCGSIKIISTSFLLRVHLCTPELSPYRGSSKYRVHCYRCLVCSSL